MMTGPTYQMPRLTWEWNGVTYWLNAEPWPEPDKFLHREVLVAHLRAALAHYDPPASS